MFTGRLAWLRLTIHTIKGAPASPPYHKPAVQRFLTKSLMSKNGHPPLHRHPVLLLCHSSGSGTAPGIRPAYRYIP